MSTQTIGPVASGERIEILDVLRGFAILGILIGNMQWFSGYGMMPPALVEQHGTLDHVTRFLVHFFIEGKFYSIFSFLFGFGFALQIARGESRGDTTASLFKRRLFWLLVIGLLHAYLLWAGDILSVYAVTGFLLLLFRKKTDASLLKWAFWMLVVPIGVYILLYGSIALFAPPGATDIPDAAGQLAGWNGQVAVVAQSSYWQIVSGYNLEYIVGRYLGLVFEMRFTKLLAMFLLGYYAYRRGFFQELSAHRPFTRKVMIYGLILGLAGNAVLAIVMSMNAVYPPTAIGIAGVIGYAVGVPALALFYIATVAMLWQTDTWRRVLSVLAPVGRMALTNYLLQTVICVVLFYGYGFALFGRFGAAAATMLALAIFVMQIVVSTIWLKNFAYGPMEWIWRQLTYRQRLPLRQAVNARAAI